MVHLIKPEDIILPMGGDPEDLTGDDYIVQIDNTAIVDLET